MEGIIEQFNSLKVQRRGVAYRKTAWKPRNISFLTYPPVPVKAGGTKSVTGKAEAKESAAVTLHGRKRWGAGRSRKEAGAGGNAHA